MLLHRLGRLLNGIFTALGHYVERVGGFPGVRWPGCWRRMPRRLAYRPERHSPSSGSERRARAADRPGLN